MSKVGTTPPHILDKPHILVAGNTDKYMGLDLGFVSRSASTIWVGGSGRVGGTTAYF